MEAAPENTIMETASNATAITDASAPDAGSAAAAAPALSDAAADAAAPDAGSAAAASDSAAASDAPADSALSSSELHDVPLGDGAKTPEKAAPSDAKSPSSASKRSSRKLRKDEEKEGVAADDVKSAGTSRRGRAGPRGGFCVHLPSTPSRYPAPASLARRDAAARVRDRDGRLLAKTLRQWHVQGACAGERLRSRRCGARTLRAASAAPAARVTAKLTRAHLPAPPKRRAGRSAG